MSVPGDVTPVGRGRAHTVESGGRSGIGAAMGALALGLVIGGGAMVLFSPGRGDPFAGRVDRARFQAVILSNDKVYFGRLTKASDDFYSLDDAYFLRESRTTEEAEPTRAVVPVNREIHAPDNRMLIRRADVVLVENLAKDSPVQREIRRQEDADR